MSPEEKWDKIRDFYERKMRIATRDPAWSFKITPEPDKIEWLYNEWRKFTQFMLTKEH